MLAELVEWNTYQCRPCCQSEKQFLYAVQIKSSQSLFSKAFLRPVTGICQAQANEI